MEDDPQLTRLADSQQTLFVLIEAKAGDCKINEAWIEEQDKVMQRVISRLGFAKEDRIEDIASAMYRSMRWEDDDYVLQYIVVGKDANPALSERYPGSKQITWKGIGSFLYHRFKGFPLKLRFERFTRPQWPRFGREYSEYVWTARREQPKRAVQRHIEIGSFEP